MSKASSLVHEDKRDDPEEAWPLRSPGAAVRKLVPVEPRSSKEKPTVILCASPRHSKILRKRATSSSDVSEAEDGCHNGSSSAKAPVRRLEAESKSAKASAPAEEKKSFYDSCEYSHSSRAAVVAGACKRAATMIKAESAHGFDGHLDFSKSVATCQQ